MNHGPEPQAPLRGPSFGPHSRGIRIASDPAVGHPLLATQKDMVRLDRAFWDAIDRGAVDVYLPNDTHAGTTGNAIAGTALVELPD